MAPINLQDHIRAAIIHRVASMVLNPAIPVAYWDQKFEKPTTAGPDKKPLPFIEEKIFVAPTADLSLGADDENQLLGFLQLNLNWPLVAGETTPAKSVAQIIKWFRRGRRLSSGPVIVEIHKMPKEATPFIQGIYSTTQITIPYQVFSKQF